MAKYKCSRCGKVVERKSDKVWIKSLCGETGIMTRIYRVKSKKGKAKKP